MITCFAAREGLASPSGANLNLYHQPAIGNELAVVQINHGLAEHAKRYARFADFLSSLGIHVYAHDHRGHGSTTAPDAPLGSFGAGHEVVLQDVAAVHTLIATRHSGLPVIIFGHSMGGLIALRYTLQHWRDLHAAAIWNANFSAGLPGHIARVVLAYERMRLGSDTPSRVLPKLTFRQWAHQFRDRRTEFDWLSRDSAEVDAYVTDPLCGWNASIGMWTAIFDLIFFGADDTNFPSASRMLPFHLVGGEMDPATSNGKAVLNLAKRMRQMNYARVTTRIYPQTRHESLNEINRQEIMENFGNWALETLQAR